MTIFKIVLPQWPLWNVSSFQGLPIARTQLVSSLWHWILVWIEWVFTNLINYRWHCGPCYLDQASFIFRSLSPFTPSLLSSLSLCVCVFVCVRKLISLTTMFFPYSVESNVIILASCIPTLQPLFEIILGKHSLRSIGNNYKDSSQTANWSSGKRSVRPQKDGLGFTITGSQENILQTVDEPETHHTNLIHRTDKVTIEYEMPSWKCGDRNTQGAW